MAQGRVQRAAECLGNLLERQLSVIPQQQHALLERRQLSERRPELFSRLGVRRRLGRISAAAVRLVALPALVAQRLFRLLASDAVARSSPEENQARSAA
jgi:hypothetical protein